MAFCCLLVIVAGLVATASLVLGWNSICRSLQASGADLAAADAIVLHTYTVNPDGTLPERGRATAEAAGEACARLGKPLIIASGRASRMPEPDQLYYAVHVLRRHPDVHVLLGADMTVASTHDEVRETGRIAKECGFGSIAAFMLTPHLVRAAYHWRRNPYALRYVLCGAAGAWRYSLWELLMIPCELALPPSSSRRAFVLGRLRGTRKRSDTGTIA